MKRILVIAITRLGDLIQTGPFIRRLKMRSPEADIDVLVEACFEDVAKMLPDVTRTIPITIERLVASLDENGNVSLAEALNFYHHDLLALCAVGYDEVWNVTHTKPSAALAFLIGGPASKGVTWSKNGLQQVNGRWLKYFFATNLSRPWCQFNLVDVYANAIENIPWNAHRNLSLHVDKSNVNSACKQRDGLRIAIHTGASMANKCWPIDSYYNVCEQLSMNTSCELLLIGSAKDIAHGQRFENIPRLRNLIGKTTVAELARELSDCDLLITNDSGPMHVAAAVGTPILALTMGSATAWETAPYGENHIIIEPRSTQLSKGWTNANHPSNEVNSIPVNVVMSAALAMLNRNSYDLANLAQTAECDIYTTRFSPDDSMLELVPLGPPSIKCTLNQAFRKPWLCALEPDRFGRKSVAKHTHGLAELSQQAMETIDKCMQLLEMLSLTITNGSHSNTADTMSIAAQLAEHERRVDSLLNTNDPLQSVRRFIQIGKGSLKDGDVRNQLAETTQIYATASVILSAIAEDDQNQSIHYSKIREQSCVLR